ncbi:NnrU family protein [Novosphingobium sp. AAP83]|uniref:NnrU family protein n=1 Tax=Novosphingobium sp. AAP83 TaxID=1523425 RepID=UPI0006B8DAC6|nr:NnrU family protein [Novosphingobium sp. AAP83]
MPIDSSIMHLVIAMASFVLSHFLMSGPFRQRLISACGAKSFLLVYSVVSLCAFGWAAVAFDRAAHTTPLWNGMHPLAWTIGSLLTITATALILPSFARNPALPGVKAAGLGTVIPSGVFVITRHPMMWGFSLWALGHMIVAPQARVIIFMGALILLGLLGSHFQDKRKLAQNTREFGPWQRNTSFWLNVRRFGNIGIVWLIAVILWFIATIIHWEAFGIPAGIWLLLGA